MHVNLIAYLVLQIVVSSLYIALVMFMNMVRVPTCAAFPFLRFRLVLGGLECGCSGSREPCNNVDLIRHFLLCFLQGEDQREESVPVSSRGNIPRFSFGSNRYWFICLSGH